MEEMIMHRCPLCDGSGKMTGLFPIYDDCVPPEKRKPIMKLGCDICDGSGVVDDEYPVRVKEGEECRELRRAYNISLREFSILSHVDVASISGFERGKKIADKDSGRILYCLRALVKAVGETILNNKGG